MFFVGGQTGLLNHPVTVKISKFA